jgi:dsRNA-specific ribonuclease
MHPTSIAAKNVLNNQPYQKLALISKKNIEDSVMNAVDPQKKSDRGSILSNKLTYHNNNMEVVLIDMEFLEKISVSKECLDSIQKFNALFFSHMLRIDADLPPDLFIIPISAIVYRNNKYMVDKGKIDALFKTENALEIMQKVLVKINGEKSAANSKKLTVQDVAKIDNINYYNSNDIVTFEGLKRVEQLDIFESMQNNDKIYQKPTQEQISRAKIAAKDGPKIANVVVSSTKKNWRSTYDAASFPRQPEQPIGVELGKELQHKISPAYKTKAEKAMEEIRSELIGRVAYAPYNERHYTLRDIEFLRVPSSSFLVRGRNPLVYETFHRHYMFRCEQQNMESQVKQFDQPLLLPLEDVRSNLPVLFYKFLKSYQPMLTNAELSQVLQYTFSSPESYSLYQDRGLAINDSSESKRAHAIFPELTEIYPKTIDPGMLYFGEFCKDLLRSVWFWNQVSKVESAFNVKYTDRVLLKQIFYHNSFLNGFESGTKLAQLGDLLSYLVTVQLTFCKSFTDKSTIKHFVAYRDRLITRRKLWDIADSLNLVQYAFIGSKVFNAEASQIQQINVELLCRVLGSILVEQGVENGLKTALKFFQNEIPYLKEYSLDSTLQIPSAESPELLEKLENAEKQLNYRFPGETKGKIIYILNNQQKYESQILEWLGDAVLRIANSMYHINEIHNKNLAAMLDIGNSNSFLARVMQELFNYKVTSLKSLKTSADAFEMVVAVMYLEAGYSEVEKFVHKIMELYEPKVEEWSKQLVKTSNTNTNAFTSFLAPPEDKSSTLSTTSKKTTRIVHSKSR